MHIPITRRTDNLPFTIQNVSPKDDHITQAFMTLLDNEISHMMIVRDDNRVFPLVTNGGIC